MRWTFTTNPQIPYEVILIYDTGFDALTNKATNEKRRCSTPELHRNQVPMAGFEPATAYKTKVEVTLFYGTC
ncbi:hypothetical protein GCM10028773_41240 [Spirosoma koreense]